MSAAGTRLLVLGAVRLFGPANGYQLRRELLSWEVDRWANVKPGSIYSMLGTLTRQGAVERHDLTEDGGRPVAVYTITEAGEAEFQRTLRAAIAEAETSGHLLTFRIALNFAPQLPRDEFLAGLRARRTALMACREEFDHKVELGAAARIPPHVFFELELEQEVLGAQLAWLDRTIAAVESGGLSFAGEPGDGWLPPDDDPGWRMVREREEYEERLRRRG